MGHGKAFAFPRPVGRGEGTPVYKTWMHSGNRTFLVEQVPLVYVADDLNALPLSASIQKPASSIKYLSRSNGAKADLLSSRPVYPASHCPTTDTNQILLAAVTAFNHEPGVVLDYSEIDSDQNSDFSFESDTTYFVNGFQINGTATFNPGTVLKFSDQGSLFCNGDILCQTTPDRPAVLTSVNDDAIGDPILNVSTGTPVTGNGIYIYQWGNTSVLKNMRYYYAGCAVMQNDPEVWNSEFHNCAIAIDVLDSQLVLRNDLFSHCEYFFMQDSFDAITLNGQNLTVDHASIIGMRLWATLTVHPIGTVFFSGEAA